MDFTMSDRQKDWLGRVQAFMTKHVRPAVPIYKQQDAEGPRWKVIPVLEDLKKKARAEGLWNMFMPPNAHEDDEFRGAGLTNLEYAPLAEEMGHIGFASEVFNCSAPDTGNMEVFMRYASKEQKRKWLRPLMDGEIRSVFLMTEPWSPPPTPPTSNAASRGTATTTSSMGVSGGRPASAIPAARSRS